MVRSRNARFYRDLPTDIWGWVDNLLFKPKDKFELFFVICEDKKMYQAWWNGEYWECSKIEALHVIKWRMLRPKERCMSDE